jgi:hypothetical protein
MESESSGRVKKKCSGFASTMERTVTLKLPPGGGSGWR